jgi:hypothetical protein
MAAALEAHPAKAGQGKLHMTVFQQLAIAGAHGWLFGRSRKRDVRRIDSQGI